MEDDGGLLDGGDDGAEFVLADLDTGAMAPVPLPSGESASGAVAGDRPGPSAAAPVTAFGLDPTRLLADGEAADAMVAGHAEVRDPKGAYTIFVVLVARVRPVPSAPTAWTIFRRYRDFLTLHDVLKKRGVVVGSPFPGKRWISMGTDAEFVNKRQGALGVSGPEAGRGKGGGRGGGLWAHAPARHAAQRTICSLRPTAGSAVMQLDTPTPVHPFAAMVALTQPLRRSSLPRHPPVAF
jgi:hypothetical protein